MIQLIDETEVAERKPYKFSEKVSEKMRKERKQKELKRKKMANSIVRINTFTEIIPDEIDNMLHGNILRKNVVF